MFSAPDLLARLQPLVPVDRCIVAYSGGVDSHVLLHAVASLRAQLGAELIAIHVDHGLNPRSVEWSRHCQGVAAGLNVRCVVTRVDATPIAGESPEEAARRARYAAFEAVLREGDVLLTAHQQDDQAETLLLQLLRGAGPRGLAAMPACAQWGPARLARPLLDWSRDELLDYARGHGLKWIDDPSNSDTRFDRNFLRREILPRLKQRWPGAPKTLARSARLSAQAAELLDELGVLDGQAAIPKPRRDERARTATRSGSARAAWSPTLAIDRLQGLSTGRQRNLLRLWLHELELPTPHEKHVDRILEMIYAAEDATPCVSWPGAEVRRYRGQLYAMRPLADIDTALELRWPIDTRLQIPGSGELFARPVTGEGIRASAFDQAAIVRLRHGGEHIRPRGRRETHTLKHLFQDAGVPPWLRDRIPLIYVGDELVCVAGHWIAEEWSARAGEAGISVELTAAW
jgi:tRNA(Ile)-lysidine synthase